MTDKNDWQKVNDSNRRVIDPVPFVGENELFTPNITADELESLIDSGGDIRFESVFEWMLPRFTIGNSQQSYFEFIAARMRNYMLHIIRTKDYKPKYYNPAKEQVIKTHHVARFFGVHLARMIRGFPSIEDTWSTREPLKHVHTAVESMPKNAYIDMYRCMHFSDDWEVNEDGSGETYWEDVFEDARYGSSPDVERHRKKYEHIEDGFNTRWKEVVNYGRWITADESRVAGWYRSAITIGPEPKPIRTGATIHSICVTHGPLATMKLHCRVYGGKHDQLLNRVHDNTATMQKWVNLYDSMLESFKGRGMCVTLDSAYMGDTLGQIAREIWLMNMVGTCQSDRSGGGYASKQDKRGMKVGTYESIIYQHRVLNLCYAMWSDNNIVKTLSNFHSPEVLDVGSGMLRRRRVDGLREQNQTEVSCPLQQKDYSQTFHLIDKGNGKESKYDLGGQTKGHNWAPKLNMRFFNFGLGNAHTMYHALCKEHTPFRRALVMEDCVNLLAHHLMQSGPSMRKRDAEHPPACRDLTNVHDFGHGRKIRSDAKGEIAPIGMHNRSGAPAPHQRLRELRVKQSKQPWRIHQSIPIEKRGKCSWGACPGIEESKAAGHKRARGYNTNHCCEECSAASGKTIYLCNQVKGGKLVLCHQYFHTKYHKKNYED